ncbi:hypothetical protein [Ensifer canadensis]|uniref:hypothetical protein n=1 Tax=Ensifer canadensis TaxID=555315 RepID=UPI0035E3C85F
METILRNIKQGIDGLNQRLGGEAKRPRYAQQLLLRACSDLARMAGNHVLANSLIQKAAVDPAMTTVTGWAAELTASPGGQLLLMSTSRSAFASILARSSQVGILGSTQQSVVVLASPAPASIVGEGEPIPVTQGSVSAMPVSPKKVAGITSFTGEQSKRSNVVSVARALLTESLGKGLDNLALTDQPPFGLLQGLTPVAAGSDPLADVQALLAAIPDASPLTSFVMHTSRWPQFLEAVGPGFPFASFPSSAAGDKLIAVDPGGLAAAVSGGEVDVTNEATLHMSDAPAQIVAGTTANPVRSLWQTDTLAMRAAMDIAWAARSGSVAFVEAVTW